MGNVQKQEEVKISVNDVQNGIVSTVICSCNDPSHHVVVEEGQYWVQTWEEDDQARAFEEGETGGEVEVVGVGNKCMGYRSGQLQCWDFG